MSEVNEASGKAVILPKTKGRFAVYDTPDGGIHVVYQADGSEESKHLEIPGHIMRMVAAIESGAMSPAKLMKMMMGSGK